MRGYNILQIVIWSILATLALAAVGATDSKDCPKSDSPTVTVEGQVYEDDSRGDKPADQRKGVASVIVSDGAQVTQTDAQGHYCLADVNPIDGGFVFVV